MKRTKNFFIALLGFCLMGSGVMAQIQGMTDGFVYTLIENDGRVLITGYNGTNTTLEFPSFEGYVTEISNKFIENTPNRANIESLNLSSVSKVRQGLFYSLVEDEITGDIVEYTFEKLKRVVLGASVYYDRVSFAHGKYKNLELSFSSTVNEVTSTMTGVFSSCVSKVDLGTVKIVGDGAFSGFTFLRSVSLADVLYIGNNAFSGCYRLNSVDLSSAISVGTAAFMGCGYDSNNSYSGLNQVIWPAKLVDVGTDVFKNCYNLVTFEDENYNNAFINIRSVADGAFSGCYSLNDALNFSSNLSSIGSKAFFGTNFDEVVVNSDPTISDDAFPASLPIRLVISDAQLCLNGYNYDNVTYSRSKNGTYGALVLPFDFEKGVNNTYYTFTSYDEKGMHFTQVEDNELKANTPYLYTGSDTKFNSVGAYTTEALVDVKGDAPDGWTSNCVYEDHSVAPITENGFMWAIQGGELKWFNSLKIKPYRAYWQTDNKNVSQNARVFVHTRDGNVTSINMAEIDGWENMVPVYYDLTGRMVNNPVKGNIYIVNGKKVVF